MNEIADLLLVHNLAFLFRSIVLHRPLLTLIGPYGCGKTVFASLFGFIFFGSRFEVLGLEDQKQDGATAYITNSVYGVLDNADERIRWLPDMLARSATGQSIPRRKLYTTNELIKYPTDIFLAVTARMTPWARPDVISRLLLFKLKPPPSYIDEKIIKSEVLKNRTLLMSELIRKANEAIGKLKVARDFDSQSRLAGFYNFGMKVSNDPKRFDSAFSKVMRIQEDLAAEEEETLLKLLLDWTEANQVKNLDKNPPYWTEAKEPTQLYAELSLYAKSLGIEFNVKNTQALGIRLKNNMALFRAAGLLIKKERMQTGRRAWKFALQSSF